MPEKPENEKPEKFTPTPPHPTPYPLFFRLFRPVFFRLSQFSFFLFFKAHDRWIITKIHSELQNIEIRLKKERKWIEDQMVTKNNLFYECQSLRLDLTIFES